MTPPYVAAVPRLTRKDRDTLLEDFRRLSAVASNMIRDLEAMNDFAPEPIPEPVVFPHYARIATSESEYFDE